MKSSLEDTNPPLLPVSSSGDQYVYMRAASQIQDEVIVIYYGKTPLAEVTFSVLFSR